MRGARAIIVVSASALAACGGFLGFGDEDGTLPPGTNEDGGDAGAANGDRDASGESDGNIGDVVIVAPPVDAAIDAPAAGQLFPRLATFEDGSFDLTGPNGADANNGMSLLTGTGAGGALRGTYAAQAKGPLTHVDFSFASQPPSDLYAGFVFRFDLASGTFAPAAFFRLALVAGPAIFAFVEDGGDVYVTADGKTGTKMGNVAAGKIMVLAIHARTNPPLLEAVLTPDPPNSFTPKPVPWPAPAPIAAASVGELTGSAMRITVDQIGFNETGFVQPEK